ncbi:MAG: hypothetical protein ACR2FM_02895 [Candidatus Saccharimonadales bacterium]
MFSGTIIGLIVGISASVWVWNKTLRRTGGNNKSSIITGAIAGIFAFIVVMTVVVLIDQSLAK